MFHTAFTRSSALTRHALLAGVAAAAALSSAGAATAQEEEFTLGELVAFISYMRLFFQPLRELSQKYSIVQSAMASAEPFGLNG